MLIVDSQIHIWENARMSGYHRQIPTYSKDDALNEMTVAFGGRSGAGDGPRVMRVGGMEIARLTILA